MKKLFSFMGCCLLAACSSHQPGEISGSLSGVGSDTLLVRSFVLDPTNTGRPELDLDTVPLVNGKFSFNLGNSTDLRYVQIGEFPSSKSNPDGSRPSVSMEVIPLILLPGKSVTIEGSLHNYKLGGDPFYESLSQLDTEIYPIMQKIDSVSADYRRMAQKGVSEEKIQEIAAQMNSLQQNIKETYVRFIKEHAEQDVSAYLLAMEGNRLGDAIGELLDLIAEPVRNGVMAPMYQSIKQSYEYQVARQKAKEKIKEGAPAPEFTLKDINGKDFALSSLKGKYVILDFWGSWCGWCIKGIPDLKKAYEKYKGQLEIVGIDCNDTEEKWKAAVEKHTLPWIHVRNEGNPDVTLLYGIEGFPTKIILDKEGNIVKTVVGEDPEFYKHLDALMKK